jgi:glyoxylase-like metal-dependent hydrolase (beta-lactamase superfamily II)
MLKIVTLTLGPVQTNCYLIADGHTRQAAAIDPAWDGATIVERAARLGWQIEQIWLTHAHFDHMAGAKAVVTAIDPAPSVAMHPQDLPLWQMKGGAPYFGMDIDPGPDPDVNLAHGDVLQLGEYQFEVRHAPGHTPGHVVFCCHTEKVTFCGDVVFYGSIGRTDMPGGSYATLMDSIQRQILTLPDETRLLSGHGPETTVGRERRGNPFLG